MSWLLHGRMWHIWRPHWIHSLCEKVTVKKLYEKPAKAIQTKVPHKGQQCEFCVRIDKPGVLPWVNKLNTHLIRQRARLSIENKVAIAERLALIGSVLNDEANTAYNRICAFLLTPQTKSNRRDKPYHTFTFVSAALELLPLDDPAKLQHVLAATGIWQRLTQRALTQDKFQRPRVIESMLAVPEKHLEAYIRHHKDKGFSHIAAMFHPNTLERAKNDPALRGVFTRHSPDYEWGSGVRVVEEDEE